MTAPKEIKVYAVVGPAGNVWISTISETPSKAIGLIEHMPFIPYWDTMKKQGCSVRRFRLVPDDAATEMEKK